MLVRCITLTGDTAATRKVSVPVDCDWALAFKTDCNVPVQLFAGNGLEFHAEKQGFYGDWTLFQFNPVEAERVETVTARFTGNGRNFNVNVEVTFKRGNDVYVSDMVVRGNRNEICREKEIRKCGQN